MTGLNPTQFAFYGEALNEVRATARKLNAIKDLPVQFAIEHRGAICALEKADILISDMLETNDELKMGSG